MFQNFFIKQLNADEQESAATAEGVMVQKTGSTSMKYGVRPAARTACADAAKLNDGMMQ